MKKTTIAIFALAATIGLAPAAVHATEKGESKKVEKKEGKAKEKAESQADLQKEAKISMEKAREIALKKVPGKIKQEELEREKGKLIYSFDITVKGKSGIEEVAVDALTGDVISVEHETPKKEAAEKKQEAKEK